MASARGPQRVNHWGVNVRSDEWTAQSRRGDGAFCVLVVDDDDQARKVVRWQLEASGYAVIEAPDGLGALDAIVMGDPDLVVLDLGLPRVGGLDVLRSVRSGRAGGRPGRPVIILSGRSGDSDRILGLDLGADDYLVKPFSPGELAARVRSVLRRACPSPESDALEVGPLRISVTARTVQVDGEPVVLTAKEFDLLAFLAAHPRRVFSKAQLLEQVWHSCPDWLSEATVSEHIHRLRAKIERPPPAPRLIRTLRSVGYQLDPGA